MLLGVYCAIPRFALSALLLILAISRTLKQLVDMYNATKQWQPNRYMNQFMRDGIFYFFMYVTSISFSNLKLTLTSSLELCSNTLYNILVTVGATATIYIPPIIINVLIMLTASLLCCTMPRFIISVRELYDRDLRGHWQGIDTGFGGLSRGVSSKEEFTSVIAFADVAQQESRATESQAVEGYADDSGMIQLEAVGAGVHQV